MVADVLRSMRMGFKALWGDLVTTGLVNLLWLVAMLLVVPAPAATAALFYYGNRKAHGEMADVRDFFFALRRYWWVGWRWGLVNLGMVAILWGDYVLTGNLSQPDTARFVQGFYLAVLMAWLLVQLYALPFLFEQEEPCVREALRNGAIMLGRNTGFSVLLGLLLAVVLATGVLLFMLSLAAGGVFLAVVGNHAVINHLDAWRNTVEA